MHRDGYASLIGCIFFFCPHYPDSCLCDTACNCGSERNVIVITRPAGYCITVRTSKPTPSQKVVMATRPVPHDARTVAGIETRKSNHLHCTGEWRLLRSSSFHQILNRCVCGVVYFLVFLVWKAFWGKKSDWFIERISTKYTKRKCLYDAQQFCMTTTHQLIIVRRYPYEYWYLMNNTGTFIWVAVSKVL